MCPQQRRMVPQAPHPDAALLQSVAYELPLAAKACIACRCAGQTCWRMNSAPAPSPENPPPRMGRSRRVSTQAPSALWQETSGAHVLPGRSEFPQWIKLQQPRLRG